MQKSLEMEYKAITLERSSLDESSANLVSKLVVLIFPPCVVKYAGPPLPVPDLAIQTD